MKFLLIVTSSIFIAQNCYAFFGFNEVISSGDDFTCALSDMGVQCWGINQYGQTDVPILKNPKQVSSGTYHACAIDDEGVKCWSKNYYSQMNVPNLNNPKQVSSGRYISCAIDDEGVKCWGAANHEMTDIPVLKNPKQVSVGSNHVCVLDDEGVKCWRFAYKKTEIIDVPVLKNPRQVSAGGGHICALDDNGVKCWRFAYKKTEIVDVPVLKNPRQVSAGGGHICALDDNGVKCWGNNSHGQSDVPSLQNPKQVSSGSQHTCAVDDNGLKCWGKGVYTGLLQTDQISGLISTHSGVTVIENQNNYSIEGNNKVPPHLKNPRQVSNGRRNSCALDDEGVKCWRVGFKNTEIIDVPVLKNPKQVSSGFTHACALDDNEIICWDWSTLPETEKNYGHADIPVLQYPTQISSGGSTSCALDDEGIKCWGSNSVGQKNVPALKKPEQISIGARHTCALDDSEVKCWGGNAGDGVVIQPLNKPTKLLIDHLNGFNCVLDDREIKCWDQDFKVKPFVSVENEIKQISFTSNSACILDGNKVRCWGDIENVPVLKNPKQIATGNGYASRATNYACAIDDEGLKCWGGMTLFPLYRLSLKNVLIKVNINDNFLQHLKDTSPPIKSTFYKHVQDYLNLKDNLSFPEKRMAFAEVFVSLASSVTTTQSQHYAQTVIPHYNELLKSLKRIIVTDKIKKEALLSIMIAALKTSLEIYQPSEKKSTVEILKMLAIAQSDPQDLVKVKEAINALETHTELLDQLLSSEKTRFLRNTINLAIENLHYGEEI